MSPERFFDFDASWAARNKKPIGFRAFGEDVELPPEMPAALVFLMERSRQAHLAGDGSTLEEHAIMRALHAAVGAERVDRWVAGGASLEQLGDILGGVFIMYRSGDPGEPLGEAPPPETGEPIPTLPSLSSSIGASSRRISTASIGST